METPSFEEILFTLRAMRRLRPDPVPDEDLRYIVEAATQAATGHNSQTWSFIVVTDPEQRRRIGEVYADLGERAIKPGAEGKIPSLPEDERKVFANAYKFSKKFGDVPALIICCMKAPRPDMLAGAATYYGSIFPAVQNLMLAARSRGLGTVLTTLHLIEEKPFKDVLGMGDDFDTVAIIPVGYPEGEFKRPVRRPAEEVTYWDRWGKQR